MLHSNEPLDIYFVLHNNDVRSLETECFSSLCVPIYVTYFPSWLVPKLCRVFAEGKHSPYTSQFSIVLYLLFAKTCFTYCHPTKDQGMIQGLSAKFLWFNIQEKLGEGWNLTSRVNFSKDLTGVIDGRDLFVKIYPIIINWSYSIMLQSHNNCSWQYESSLATSLYSSLDNTPYFQPHLVTFHKNNHFQRSN